MILFMILMIALVVMVTFSVLIIGVGGGVFTIIFADVIVCVFLLAWLIKNLFKKRK